MDVVKAAELVLDHNIYPRHQVNKIHVADLRRAIEAGFKMPPIVADRKSKRVVDGFHRVQAVLRISPDAVVDVEWRDYPSEADLLLDAIALNSAHGEKLTPYDRARCIALAEQLRIDMVRLAEALRVRTVELDSLRVRKLAYSDGKPVPIKRTLEAFAGRELTPRQVQGNKIAGGPPPLFFVNQVKNLIENNLIDKGDESLMAALQELYEMLGMFLRKRRAASD